MVAVVFDRDLHVFPAHIEIGNYGAEFAADRDLCLWSRQARLNQQQSKPRLFWRLGSCVHKTERGAGLPDTAPPRIAPYQ